MVASAAVNPRFNYFSNYQHYHCHEQPRIRPVCRPVWIPSRKPSESLPCLQCPLCRTLILELSSFSLLMHEKVNQFCISEFCFYLIPHSSYSKISSFLFRSDKICPAVLSVLLLELRKAVNPHPSHMTSNFMNHITYV